MAKSAGVRRRDRSRETWGKYNETKKKGKDVKKKEKEVKKRKQETGKRKERRRRGRMEGVRGEKERTIPLSLCYTLHLQSWIAYVALWASTKRNWRD